LFQRIRRQAAAGVVAGLDADGGVVGLVRVEAGRQDRADRDDSAVDIDRPFAQCVGGNLVRARVGGPDRDLTVSMARQHSPALTDQSADVGINSSG